jgi:hypothetical protein
MKNTLLNHLIVTGATKRLEEVNKERENLLKIINKYSERRILIIDKPKVKTKPVRKYKGKHWTQLPKNRARVAKWMKKMQAAKRIKDAKS